MRSAETCPIPLVYDGHALATRIIDLVAKFGSVISFKAYLGNEAFSQESRAVRSELQLSGVSLTHAAKGEESSMTAMIGKSG